MLNNHVLFVDDDLLVCKAFERSLRRTELELDVAASSAAAMQLAANKCYAVIALDYNLGDVNGLVLAEELRRVQPHASYFLVSGACELGVALESINESGFIGIVPKPWCISELTQLLTGGIAEFEDKVALAAIEQRAVREVRHTEQLRRRLDEATAHQLAALPELLLGALALRGHENPAHCRRVARYAALIAPRLGFAKEGLAALRAGALLHDIGMIGLPDVIFERRGPLTADERRLLRGHAALGAKVLDGLEQLRDARTIILEHHERWDGMGYPARLRGAEISLAARVVALADCLDAMLTGRPYRAAFTLAQARRSIAALGGTQLDPAVVAAFAGVPDADIIAAHDCAAGDMTTLDAA